jgi:hypothetical protein
MKEKWLYFLEIAAATVAGILFLCYVLIYFLIKPITGGQ